MRIPLSHPSNLLFIMSQYIDDVEEIVEEIVSLSALGAARRMALIQYSFQYKFLHAAESHTTAPLAFGKGFVTQKEAINLFIFWPERKNKYTGIHDDQPNTIRD
jgi:hypothetical protein